MDTFTPWQVVVNPINMRRVVQTDIGYIDPCDGLTQDARDIERAKLIAAAPDLYAALQIASQGLIAGMASASQLPNATASLTAMQTALEQARAALAKVNK